MSVARLPILTSTAKLALGAARFWLSGKTPDYAYKSMIALFCRSGGVTNDLLARMISWLHVAKPLADNRGVLGDLAPAGLAETTRRLDEDGYFVFPERVPTALCDRLLEFALTQNCTVRRVPEAGGSWKPVPVERYDRARPEGVRYDFRAQDLIDNPLVQSLMADHSIIAVAQHYLRCEPVVDVVSMWWHTAYSSEADPDAAQYYHFDMDRIKWLKFFIYLTDVGPENGPHCFVKGSHRTGGIPERLLSRGYARLTDAEVRECYPPDRLIEFTARRGTVIAEDTRGLHKGKHVDAGDRLILQLQFSSSLFGTSYEPARFSRVTDRQLQAALLSHPRLYANYSR